MQIRKAAIYALALGTAAGLYFGNMKKEAQEPVSGKSLHNIEYKIEAPAALTEASAPVGFGTVSSDIASIRSSCGSVYRILEVARGTAFVLTKELYIDGYKFYEVRRSDMYGCVDTASIDVSKQPEPAQAAGAAGSKARTESGTIEQELEALPMQRYGTVSKRMAKIRSGCGTEYEVIKIHEIKPIQDVTIVKRLELARKEDTTNW